MYKVLHSRDGIERLYVSSEELGRGYGNIADSVGTSMRGQKDYVKKSKECLVKKLETRLTI